MAQDMEAKLYLFFRYQEFSKQLQQVHGAMSVNAILNLSVVYLPSCDYNDGKLKQRFPNCVHRHDYVESRDQSMLLVLRNKHNGHHLEQKLHDVKVEPSGDMGFEQIYLVEQLTEVQFLPMHNAKLLQSLQPLLRESSRPESEHGVLK
jgi:hypothetical protein